MAFYTTVVGLIVTLVLCVNIIVFSRKELLSKNSIFNISVASIVMSISFPMVLNGFMETSTSINFSLVLFTSIIACLALIVIISVIISGISGDEKINRIVEPWKGSMFFQSLEKNDYLKSALVNENTGLVEVKEPLLSVQGKNILEKSVDTDKNTDTMGIETFYSGSLFLDDSIAIQTNNKTEEFSSEFIDNLIITPWESSSNSTENIESFSSIDDYEVFEDYFEEEVLNEYLHLESKYGSENGQITENREVDLISFICDEVNSDSILQKEISNKSEDEYLDNRLDIVFSEIILDDTCQEQIYTDYGIDDCDVSSAKKMEFTDDVKKLVAAHMDEPVEDCESINLVMQPLAEAKSLDDIIKEAFELKEKGDFEGAILNYFYALDNEPEDDVVFWIVLDICVLYKQLGQVELAREVLGSYISQFGEIMDKTVRREIELNLQ